VMGVNPKSLRTEYTEGTERCWWEAVLSVFAVCSTGENVRVRDVYDNDAA